MRLESLQTLIDSIGAPAAYLESGRLLNSAQDGDYVLPVSLRTRLIQERMWLADRLAGEYLRLCGIGTNRQGEMDAYRTLFDNMKVNDMAIFDRMSFLDVVRGYGLLAAEERGNDEEAVSAFAGELDHIVQTVPPTKAREAFLSFREKCGNISTKTEE